MNTNREILKDALNTGKALTFLRSGQRETNVKIVYLNPDDVCNKDFVFETINGTRYNSFENNITILNNGIY